MLPIRPEHAFAVRSYIDVSRTIVVWVKLFVEVVEIIPNLIAIAQIILAEIEKPAAFGAANFVTPVAIKLMQLFVVGNHFFKFRFGNIDAVGLMKHVQKNFGNIVVHLNSE